MGLLRATQVVQCGKASTCQCKRCWRLGFDPWVGKIPWRKKWQSIQVFLPGKFHGLRNLVGYSPQSSKKSDISEHTHTRYSQYIYGGSGLVAKLCPTLVTPWTIAHQAPLSMEFPRQKYWRNLPFPAPGDLPDTGIKLTSLASPALAG